MEDLYSIGFRVDKETARRQLIKGAEKFFKVTLTDKNFNRIYGVFSDAIEKVKIYNQLLTGELVIERVGVSELVLTDNAHTPKKYVISLPESLL